MKQPTEIEICIAYDEYLDLKDKDPYAKLTHTASSYYCFKQAFLAGIKFAQPKLQTHWVNPWEDAISVPIEELAECHAGLGEMYSSIRSGTFTMTKETVLKHWKNAGDKLDAYILPQPDGDHSIGIRYGNDGEDYLSPAGDKEKVQALLDKYKDEIDK